MEKPKQTLRWVGVGGGGGGDEQKCLSTETKAECC